MKPKILIVDDNANQTLVLKMHLGLKGYESVVASTITEAKTILQAQTINLIVSDIHLPDGIGSEILSSIDPIKSIAISGDTEPRKTIHDRRTDSNDRAALSGIALAFTNLRWSRARDRR
jgi:DNA-binding NtrC family response regulator